MSCHFSKVQDFSAGNICTGDPHLSGWTILGLFCSLKFFLSNPSFLKLPIADMHCNFNVFTCFLNPWSSTGILPNKSHISALLTSASQKSKSTTGGILWGVHCPNGKKSWAHTHIYSSAKPGSTFLLFQFKTFADISFEIFAFSYLEFLYMFRQKSSFSNRVSQIYFTNLSTTIHNIGVFWWSEFHNFNNNILFIFYG